MNSKAWISIIVIFLISTVSGAITVDITAPDSETTINSLTTTFDITFNLTDYNPEHSFTADIYLDIDNDSTDKTPIDSVNMAIPAHTYHWNTTSITEGNYYIYIEVIDDVNSDNNGNSYSASFLVDKTLPEPVTNLTATARESKIDLSWTASISSDTKEYNVYESKTNGFTPGTDNLIGTTSGTSYSRESLAFGLTYYYIVKTVDNADNLSVDSTEVNSTPLDETPPETTASGFTDGTWTNGNPVTVTLSCDDTNTGSGCQITYYKLDDANFSEYTSSFDITDDGEYTLEYYSIDAEGNEETIKPAAIRKDSTDPTGITDLNATANDLTINLSWTASTDKNGSGIKKYYVFRGDSVLIASSTTNSYTDSGLDNNTTYIYYVTASDYADNNSSASNDANATALDTTGPTVTSNADSSWHTGTQTIELKSNNLDFSTMHYKINGTEPPSTNANPKYVEISSEGENSLEFWATDDLNNEGTHTTVLVKIDNSPPNAPSLSSPGANSNGEVTLSWSKPSDNPGTNSGLNGYKIYRKTGSESYSIITTITNPDTTSFTDTGRSQGTTFYYKITAYDNLSHESDLINSNEQAVTMPSDSPNTGGDIVPPSVSWRSPENGITIKDINITLKAFISDTSELKFISFTYKKTSESSFHSIKSLQENLFNGNKTVTWNTSGLENGKYNLKVLARDAPGNINSKTITVTLEREKITAPKDINSDANKSEKLLLAEAEIEKAKQSKIEAMDLINHWKKSNIDFSSDKRIIEGQALVKKAENEMQEEKLNESIENAKKAKQLFDEFSSETTVTEYKTGKMNSENKINLSEKFSNENEKLKKDITTIRKIQLIEIKYNEKTYYQENTIIKIKNTSNKTKTTQIIELIPKELIESSDDIKSNFEFSVIEKDPVIKWETTLDAGEEKEIIYSLNKKLNKKEADQMADSKISFQGNPVLLETKTKINKDSFNSVTGFFLLDNLFPIGLVVLIIIVLAGVFLFLKNKGFTLGSQKEDSDETSFGGLADVYNQNFKEKRSLREEEPPKQRIKLIGDKENGGKFSYKGN